MLVYACFVFCHVCVHEKFWNVRWLTTVSLSWGACMVNRTLNCWLLEETHFEKLVPLKYPVWWREDWVYRDINVWLNTDAPVLQGHRSLHVWLCTVPISCIKTVSFLLLFVCVCFVNKATRLINKMVITFKDFTAQVRSIKLGVWLFVHIVCS